jgi:hypothetical protein
MKNLLDMFTTPNVVSGLFLSLVAWLCLSIVDIQTVQAVMATEQVEDKRVNELVYIMKDSVIRIDENVKLMREEQKMLSAILIGQQRQTGEYNEN